MLVKIKAIFFQHFEAAVDDCCMRIDLEFGLQLGKNRGRMSTDQYLKLLEYLRSVRKDIKQNYLLKVNDIFDDSYQKTSNSQVRKIDFSTISLISDDTVTENHAIAQIISHCEHLFYEELAGFNKLYALQSGKHTIADSQNPIFPEKLVRALVEVVKPLKLNAESRIALYKTFQVNVFSQLGFIYRELIKSYETSLAVKTKDHSRKYSGVLNSQPLYVVGEIKEEVEPDDSALAEQPGAEFSLLQSKLELWRSAHTPSAYDLIPATGNVFYEHFEIRNALQILHQFNDDSGSEEKKPLLKWRVLKKLEELSFSDKVNNLARHDEDLLDLVALIFSVIERDELLQDSIKTAILQLETPLAAASLGRYSVFITADNPVRRLLDDLFSAGTFLNVAEDDDRLIQECIARVVKKITKDSGFGFSVWAAEASEFSNYLNKQKQRSRNVEESVKQFMRNKQALEMGRKMVVNAIENSMEGKTAPLAIAGFLRNVWSDVLLDAYINREQQPEQWEKSVRAMDELIISVMPLADDNEKKRVLKLLPGLIAELRNGLKQISYDKSAQARFFKDLAVWHIILMDKKQAKKAEGDTGKDNAVFADVEKIKADAIEDESSELAKNLAVESWVAFVLESGKQWGKLIWKDANNGNMMFVGKNGEKMLEIKESELAEKLRLGQATLVKVEDKTITERVLSGLMVL